jgi:hypothetical protein
MPFSYHTKVGDRFGSRVITGFLRERDTDGHLRCAWKCDCGTKGTAGLKAFRHTRQCEKCRNRNQPGGTPTHGHAGTNRTKLYDAWANMMQRTNPTSGGERNRRWYSDRGITVCPEWRKFEAFRDWAVTNGWEKGLSLERRYSCRNYEPRNCEWITRRENSRRAVQDEWRRYDTTPIEVMWGAI